MTGDDIARLIVTGTGAAATLYTIAHQEQNPSLMRQTVGTDLGTSVYNPYNPYSSTSTQNLLVIGFLLAGAYMVLKS
jgi:hypothetical protein